jgi:SAM-dependent methyltransferase
VRDETADFSVTIERFTGFADLYDAHRPRPPDVLAEVLTQVARTAAPRLVVDLGCGTGLSTRYWAERAERVIGIDPTADMRRQAEARTSAPNVSYHPGLSHATGLPDACADLVTCGQALHWMEPQGTFGEVARILRPGGVFAAYDYDWPPTTTHWEAEAAYATLQERVARLEQEYAVGARLPRWAKSEHAGRMRASGAFRYVREMVVHHCEPGNAARLIGLVASQGSVAALRKRGVGDAELGFDVFAATVGRTLGEAEGRWFFSYRLRLGVV